MAQENTPHLPELALSDETSGAPPCVLVFNANDPSGAGGLSADILAAAGLAVALPAVLAFNVMGRIINRLEQELEGFAHDLREL